eukprot:scaffold89396_cov66-Phaeocystis_antarctica.AAC.3
MRRRPCPRAWPRPNLWELNTGRKFTVRACVHCPSSPRRTVSARRTAPVPGRADERHLRPAAKPDGQRRQAAPARAQAQPARRPQERARVLHAGQLPRAQQSEPPHLRREHAVRQRSAVRTRQHGPAPTRQHSRKRCSSDTQPRTPGGLAEPTRSQLSVRLLCPQAQAGSSRACERAVRACHRPPTPIGQAARLRAGEARRRRRGDRAGAGRAAARRAPGVAAAGLLPCLLQPQRCPPPRPQPGTAAQPGGVPRAATGGAGDGGGLAPARQVRRRGPTVPLGCRRGVHLARVGVSARVDLPPEEWRGGEFVCRLTRLIIMYR